MRKLVIALEKRLKTSFGANHIVVQWLIEHAGFVHNRFVIGHDGMTPHQRSTGKKYRGHLVEFGEQVMAKVTKLKRKNKRKLGARLV